MGAEGQGGGKERHCDINRVGGNKFVKQTVAKMLCLKISNNFNYGRKMSRLFYYQGLMRGMFANRSLNY